MSDNKTRAMLASAVRNAATSQCIFTPMDNFELSWQNGQLYKVTPNTSHYDRGYMPVNLRVEELPGMPDDEIWKRVMGQ